MASSSQPVPIKEKGVLNLLELGLDWGLAARRLRIDIRDDFWPDPLGFKDILRPQSNWLHRMESHLAAYRPRRGASYAIPKANFTIRDSIHITPLDRLVYQALVDQLIPFVDPKISPTVFSHRLRQSDAEWIFLSPVQQWKQFHDAVRSAIRERPNAFLIMTDVSHYFEGIRLKTLRRHLLSLLGERAAALRPCVNALSDCLQAWSPYREYGLVQNVDASSFLGNVLLDYVDKRMTRDGYLLFRYMDDIRIVVTSERDARKALERLVCHLREIGLWINAAKTGVLHPGSPKLFDVLCDDDPEIAAIEAAIGMRDRNSVQQIVGTLFNKTIRLIEEGKVGDKVFRFCLNRIASLRAYNNLDLPEGTEITDMVLQLLVSRPVETDTFCKYLESAPLNEHHLNELARLLVSEQLTVYAWQNFHLWRLASQRNIRRQDLTIRAHQTLEASPTSPDAGGAALYLGQRGDYADRSALAQLLPQAARGLLRRCLQISIQEFDRAERNRAYDDLGEDSEAAALSDHIANQAHPTYVDRPIRVGIDELPDLMPSVYA
jgi:hypothetical protein